MGNNIMDDDLKQADICWSNADNSLYYESIPIETLRKYATIGGFENGCDIDLIFDRIKDAESVIEIGAGYGRVLHNLIKRGYAGKLYAIERSKQFCNHLHKCFSKDATIINHDINRYTPNRKFSVILWLWSSISDFPKTEHISILKKLENWLQDDGLFILDTISHKTKLADEFTFENQTYIEKAAHGTAYGYVPSTQEIAEYADILGFKIEQISYNTETNRPRIIHILSKQKR